jgi:hypothetical protein
MKLIGNAYDANGNIKAMTRAGLLINSSSTIDNLTYTYNTYSNKLLKVTDAITLRLSIECSKHKRAAVRMFSTTDKTSQ